MNSDWVALDELITEIRNGLDAEQHDVADSGMLPISRIETISDGTIDLTRVKYVRVTDAQIAKYKLCRGDILFSHINSPEHIGKTALFDSDETLIHGINLLLLRPDKGRCDSTYLNYYLKSFEIRARFRARCKKAVNQASLNQGDILDLEVPLPPLPEQQRIATILDRADRLRRMRRYAAQLSEAFLQAVFVRMFGDPVRNAMGWDVEPIGEHIDSIRYGTGSPPDYQDDGLPFIRAMNIKRGTIQPEGMAFISKSDAENISKCQVRKGNLIIVRSGINAGDCAVVPAEYDGAFAAYDLIVELPYPRNIYYNHLINSMYGKAIIEPLTRRAGQPHLNAEQIQDLHFPLPPDSLQEKFARIVQQFERLRAQQREAERQAEHLFQTLLHRAFEGGL